MTLENLLDMYTTAVKNKEQVLIKDEKSILLLESQKDGNFLHLKFEIIRYGEKKDIKDRNKNFSTISTLGISQYVQELQYITLKKISDDSYDIAIQGKQIGITYNKLYNLIRDFYILKKRDIETYYKEGYADTDIRIHVYRTAEFFKKLENIIPNFIHIVSSDPLKEEDPDLIFSDKTSYKTKIDIKIREKKGFLKFGDKYTSLKAFIEKKLKEYPDAKLNIKGIDNNGKDKDIFSTDVDYRSEIKIKTNADGQLNEEEIKFELKKSIEEMERDGYNRIKM
ncbi:MAG: hypothetical protein MJH09_00855 [Cetobacterium sp.]|nr:hypothetical protein [Cetobacterium sp.]